MTELVPHRVGRLAVGDDIVFVGTSVPHRQAVLDASAYIMDFPKDRAPFWKREGGPDREQWGEARASDCEALRKW